MAQPVMLLHSNKSWPAHGSDTKLRALCRGGNAAAVLRCKLHENTAALLPHACSSSLEKRAKFVADRIAHIGAIPFRLALAAHAGPAFVRAARLKRNAMEGVDRRPILGLKSQHRAVAEAGLVLVVRCRKIDHQQVVARLAARPIARPAVLLERARIAQR